MATFQGDHFINEHIQIDGQTFRNCHFLNCVLVYRGGPLPSFDRSDLVSSVVRYEGAALRTIQLLQMFNAIGFHEVADKVIDTIKGHPPDGSPPL